jgi:LPXTG-motif cell wall-anchored protein
MRRLGSPSRIVNGSGVVAGPHSWAIARKPTTEIEHQRKLTGSMPPPPPAPAADAPILVAVNAPPPTPAASTAPAAPAELPKTGSFLPLFGLLGMLFLVSALGLRVFRKSC